MKVIYILWLRQMKRYFRSKSRIFGSLAQPLLFLFAFSFGFGPIFAKAGQGNYLEFLAPGVIGQSILFTSIFSGLEIIWDRQFGFLKETLVAPVSRIKIMIGRTLGGATVAVFQGLIVLILSIIFGFTFKSYLGLLQGIIFMILISVLFAGLGTAIASSLTDPQGFQLIMNFLIMPLFFLSGAFFPVQNLPAPFLIIVKMNPLSYGVDSLRGSLIGITYFGLLTDFFVLFTIASIFTIIGSYLFSKIEV